MKNKINIFVATMVMVAMAISGYHGFTRYKVDEGYNHVQLLVNFDDIKKIASNSQLEVAEVSKAFKEAGMTGVIYKERTIKPTVGGAMNALTTSNDVMAYQGVDLVSQFLISQPSVDISTIKKGNQYLYVPDPQWTAQIQSHLKAKTGYAEMIKVGDYEFLDVGPANAYINNLGVGYSVEEFEALDALGLTVSPMIKEWTITDEASIDFVINEWKKIPNLNGVYFNDENVPAYDNEKMQSFVKEEKGGFVEFFSKKQKGIETLLRATEENGSLNMLRLHSINEEQMKKLSEKQSLDQIELAVNERNIRAVLIGFPTTGAPTADYQFALDFVAKTKVMLEADGFVISSEMQVFSVKPLSIIGVWFIGLGAILVLLVMGQKLGLFKWALAAVFIGILGYTGLLVIKPHLAKQLMAMYAAIIYPVLGMFLFLKEDKRSVLQTAKDYFLLSGVTLMGALSIVGLLTTNSYAMNIDQFRGIKIVGVVPILFIVLLMSFKYERFSLKEIKEFLLKPVNYLIIGILGTLAVMMLIYLKRTGNGGSVSSLELMFRQFLSDVLVVRPRTKEFLIGHPILVVLMMWGYKKRYIPLMIVAMIAQTSMVNTFQHLHTPIMASFIRTVHGLWIGLVLGLIGYFVLEQIRKFLVKKEIL